MMGLAPVEVKFETTSLEEMTFILGDIGSVLAETLNHEPNPKERRKKS